MEEKKSSEAVKAIVTVNIHAARDLLHSGHIYLDVRMLEEFNIGHVENALNVPYYASVTPEGKVKNPLFMEQVSVLCSKNDHILVGCRTGVRSLLATVNLLNAGFKHVKNIAGGYSAWVDNGFDVEGGLA